MVGLLNAPLGTRLYDRLASENRLETYVSGDNTDFTMNFKPVMSQLQLLKGYERVIETIYSPKTYYDRIKIFFKTYKPTVTSHKTFSLADIKAVALSVWLMGIKGPGRQYYWKAIIHGLLRPRCFTLVLAFLIMGMHFRKSFEDARPNLKYLEHRIMLKQSENDKFALLQSSAI